MPGGSAPTETCRMPSRRTARLLPTVLLLFPSAVRAGEDRAGAALPGESRATAARLAEADRLLAGQKWGEAFDELQAVLDTSGDDLVPVDATQSVRARRLVHVR